MDETRTQLLEAMIGVGRMAEMLGRIAETLGRIADVLASPAHSPETRRTVGTHLATVCQELHQMETKAVPRPLVVTNSSVKSASSLPIIYTPEVFLRREHPFHST